MVGAFAEFERAMLKERTKAGLDAARKEGRIGGRPPKLKPHQQQEIVTLVKQGKKTAADAAVAPAASISARTPGDLVCREVVQHHDVAGTQLSWPR